MIVLNWFSNILYRHIIWVKKLNLFFPIQKNIKNKHRLKQKQHNFPSIRAWLPSVKLLGPKQILRRLSLTIPEGDTSKPRHGWARLVAFGSLFFLWPTWLGIPPNGGSKYGKKCWKKNSGLLVGVPFAFGTTFFGGGLTYRFQIFTSDMEEMMQNEEYLFPVCGQKIRTRTHSLFFCFSLVRWCDSVFSVDFGEKTAKTCKDNHPFQATPELYT